MFNKKRIITAVVLVVVTITIVIAVAVMLFRSSSNTIAMPGATAVGVPNGLATTKSIGPAGGSIASHDGRIVVEVPPNAVPDPIDFSIQPITNLARGGLRNAYRLGPAGRNFAETVKVSFKYDAQDLKGTFPDALAVAYQDTTGVWQAFKAAHLDQASKTLTVSTTHFTDFTGLAYQLWPDKVTLKVRESQFIQLVECSGKGNLMNQLKNIFGRGEQERCFSRSTDKPIWSATFGKIVPDGRGAMYTAPAKKPAATAGRDRVFLTYTYVPDGSKQRAIGTFEAEITIIDGGYRATGGTVDDTVSGEICSLEKPFTVNGITGGAYQHFWKFVPSSATSGTVTMSGKGPRWTAEYGGKYTIEGADTDRPRIVLTISGSGTMEVVGTKSSTNTAYIDLVPLDKDECK